MVFGELGFRRQLLAAGQGHILNALDACPLGVGCSLRRRRHRRLLDLVNQRGIGFPQVVHSLDVFRVHVLYLLLFSRLSRRLIIYDPLHAVSHKFRGLVELGPHADAVDEKDAAPDSRR